MMKKDSSIKFSILNITGLILFQIVHTLLDIKKASIVNTEKLTQNQIMYQMRYSNIHFIFTLSLIIGYTKINFSKYSIEYYFHSIEYLYFLL